MDNHKLMLKISRLFPSSLSSCQFRNLSDVAETSINLISKENDHSSLSLQKLSTLPKTSHKKSLPPSHHPHPTKTDNKRAAAAAASLHHSSTSNGGWFTSSDDLDTDTFFSLSSNSGDSFRLRTASHRFKRRDGMKSIDEEVGRRRSFSSAASFDTVPSKCSRRTAAAAKKPIKPRPDQRELLGSDHVSTQLYYRGGGRRRGGRDRRRTKKSGGAVIGESYAVEKNSSDPRSDFRASMVEMIVEKQIFAAAELERLLRCFLSLNAAAYHGIIFDVFSEICQTLFNN